MNDLPLAMTFDFNAAREAMVEQQIRPWDVLDLRVLDVLSRLPREAFVNEIHQSLAYADLALPIGHDQTMMKPVLEGRTLQALALEPGEEVLEIGTGSGFLTACLASLARAVTSIELHADLADTARARLAAQGFSNVRIEQADALHWQPGRQFDAICVTAAAWNIPAHFFDWLKPGGRMLIVRGRAPAMEAVLLHHSGNDVNAARIESLFETELPYLIGAAPPPAFTL